MPGMPPQVICYERADDIGFGVSGVVTRGARDSRELPGSRPVADPDGGAGARGEGRLPARSHRRQPPVGHAAARRPLDPRAEASPALRGRRAATSVHPAVPAQGRRPAALHGPVHPMGGRPGDGDRPGADLAGHAGGPARSSRRAAWPACGSWTRAPTAPGTPTRASCPAWTSAPSLTVVGDGPVGPVGRQLDEHFGLPAGHHQREWAVGMKMVVDLPDDCALEPGTVLHTFGYPEPEIFGFLYVYPDRLASLGIFVPSWFDSPVRTAYRYLQHWMLHPYLWRHLRGGTLRSWGAKTLQESGRRGEPHLAGDGYARIGEGSGSTNVLTGSGVDEAWTTGVQARRRGPGTPARRPAVHQGEPRAGLRRAAPGELGRGGRSRRRAGARRVPARRGVGPRGHGPGRAHGRAVGSRRPIPTSGTADPAPGGVSTPGGSRRPRWSRFARTVRSARSRSTTR